MEYYALLRAWFYFIHVIGACGSFFAASGALRAVQVL